MVVYNKKTPPSNTRDLKSYSIHRIIGFLFVYFKRNCYNYLIMANEKMFKCVKCKEEKPESEGVMIYEGSAFCCNECKEEMDKGKDKKESNTCEFC